MEIDGQLLIAAAKTDRAFRGFIPLPSLEHLPRCPFMALNGH
jgi:hypothetical protein